MKNAKTIVLFLVFVGFVCVIASDWWTAQNKHAVQIPTTTTQAAQL